jgi:hypothetical protein
MKHPAKHTAAGRRLIQSVKQAVAWASGEDVPVRVSTIEVDRKPHSAEHARQPAPPDR